ncbi:reverse transcriptase domain-containing protein, partial [Tanacetum coccineum]
SLDREMENMIDNSDCAENQKVRYAASSLVNKALTWWNIQVQARRRVAAMVMTWNDFKALMVEEFCSSNEMEKLENEYIVGLAPKIRGMLQATQLTTIQNTILRAGILTDEAVSCGTLTKGNDKRKVVEESGSKCNTHHPVNGPCNVCYNCKKPGHYARNCWAPIRQVAQVNVVRMSNNPRVCYECGSPDHFRGTCPKMNRALGQTGNQLALEGSRNN